MSPAAFAATPAVASRTRPGLVTAMGVTGIIVAVISMVGGMISGSMVYFRFTIGAQAANNARSVTTGASTPGGVPAVSFLPTPSELAAQQQAERGRLEFRRDALVNLFNELQPMSPNQQQHLGAIFGQYGDRLLPQNILQAVALSPADLREEVTRSGSERAASEGQSDAVYFELKTGRLDVADDGAVFRPATGGARLRAARGNGPAPVAGLRGPPSTLPTTQRSPATTAPSTIYRSGFTEAEVAGALQNIQKVFTQQTGKSLNGAQLAALRSELQNTTPPIVSRQTLYAPLSQAQLHPDGSALLKLTNHVLMIDASGVVTMNYSMGIHQVVLDPVVGVLMIGEFIASELLAIFLLIAAIAILRDYRRSAGLYWIYALLKLPVAVLGGVVMTWGVTQFVNQAGKLNRSASAAPSTDGFVTFVTWVTIGACIYPVILIILLSTRTMRQFFAAQRARPS